MRIAAESGVYAILNWTNGKLYIGSSFDVRQRINKHQNHLRRGIHDNVKLQRSYDKVGPLPFQFKQILICAPEHCVMYEQILMDALKPEYNLAPVAGSTRGATWKWSEESRAKMVGNKNSVGVKRTEAQKILMKENSSRAMRGRKGKHHSDRTKKVLSERMFGNQYALGFKRTEDQKKRNSEGQRTRYAAPEERQKQSEIVKARWAKAKSTLGRFRKMLRMGYAISSASSSAAAT